MEFLRFALNDAESAALNGTEPVILSSSALKFGSLTAGATAFTYSSCGGVTLAITESVVSLGVTKVGGCIAQLGIALDVS
jgi:hypothetical protein